MGGVSWCEEEVMQSVVDQQTPPPPLFFLPGEIFQARIYSVRDTWKQKRTDRRSNTHRISVLET